MIKTITLGEKEKTFLKQFIEKINIAKVGSALFVEKYKTAQDELWQEVRKVFPNIPMDDIAKPTFDFVADKDWTITYWDKNERK